MRHRSRWRKQPRRAAVQLPGLGILSAERGRWHRASDRRSPYWPLWVSSIQEFLGRPEAALELLASGAVRDVLHPTSVARVAGLFGVPVEFSFVHAASRSLVVPDSSQALLQAAKRLVASEVRRRGLVELDDLAQRAEMSVDALTVLVDADHRLYRHKDAVWKLPDAESHLLPRTLDRLLAIAPRNVTTLREGLAVAWRYHAHAQPPSAAVLRAYLASQPRYELHGEDVRLASSSVVQPSRVDQALLDAYSIEGTAELTADRLREQLIGAGIAPAGARSLLTTSPLLKRTRRAHYRLRQFLS